MEAEDGREVMEKEVQERFERIEQNLESVTQRLDVIPEQSASPTSRSSLIASSSEI